MSSLDRAFLSSDNDTANSAALFVTAICEEDETGDELNRSKLLSPAETELRTQLAKLSIAELRQRLREAKCSFGPIDQRNRRVYEKKLAVQEGVARVSARNHISRMDGQSR